MSNILADIANGLFYALDTPGALTRGALSGRPGDRASGRDMLEAWGLLGRNRPGFDMGDVAGFGADLVVDPLNLLGGLGLFGKASKAAKVGKANRASMAMRRSPTQLLQRWEEPGVARALVSKPHGVYTSPGNVKSPHAELGGQQFWWEPKPNASVLDVPSYPGGEMAMRRMAMDAGAGVHAARKLLGEKTFSVLHGAKRADLEKWASRRYPGTDFSRYYDNQEIVEAIGGMEARNRGYDAFLQVDPDPAWTEHVLLTESAATPYVAPVLQTAPRVAPLAAGVGSYNLGMSGYHATSNREFPGRRRNQQYQLGMGAYR